MGPSDDYDWTDEGRIAALLNRVDPVEVTDVMFTPPARQLRHPIGRTMLVICAPAGSGRHIVVVLDRKDAGLAPWGIAHVRPATATEIELYEREMR